MDRLCSLQGGVRNGGNSSRLVCVGLCAFGCRVDFVGCARSLSGAVHLGAIPMATAKEGSD